MNLAHYVLGADTCIDATNPLLAEKTAESKLARPLVAFEDVDAAVASPILPRSSD